MSPNANNLNRSHSQSHHPGNPCTPECTGHPEHQPKVKVTARRATGKKPKYAAFALQDDGKWKRISHWYGSIKNADDAAERYAQRQPYAVTETVEADEGLQARLNEEPTAYEETRARQTGATVEQLRKEQAEAEAKTSAVWNPNQLIRDAIQLLEANDDREGNSEDVDAALLLLHEFMKANG